MYLLFALLNADMSETQREASRRASRKIRTTSPPRRRSRPHARWLGETQRRLAFRAVWQKYFESHDVFLLPTGFTAAFPHDHSEPIATRRRDSRRETAICSEHSLLDLRRHVGGAASDSGAGWADERRFASRNSDRRTDVGRRNFIEFARLIADTVGGFMRPPGF